MKYQLSSRSANALLEEDFEREKISSKGAFAGFQEKLLTKGDTVQL